LCLCSIFLFSVASLPDAATVQVNPQALPLVEVEPAGLVNVRTWPTPYTLPAFPPALLLALTEKDASFKDNKKSAVRANLMQVLFDDVSRFTWYVTH